MYNLSEKYSIQSKVINLGYQPNSVSRSIQTQSDVLLLMGWNNPLDKGVLYAKVFEYLKAKSPFSFPDFQRAMLQKF